MLSEMGDCCEETCAVQNYHMTNRATCHSNEAEATSQLHVLLGLFAAFLVLTCFC